jgi:toxin FitB
MPILLLDSHPLSLISNPVNKKENLDCKSRIKSLVGNGILVVVPEIIDYELRRTLIQGKKASGLEHLDKVGSMGLIYAPITTEVMLKASQLWAWARNTNQSTAHENKIDIDVILAAQAIILAEETKETTIIATSNVKDIERYTPAKKWQEITIDYINTIVSKSKIVEKEVVLTKK